MRIKFLRDELYENVGRKQGHPFKKGEVYDVTEDFGERWIRRQAAEAVGSGKNTVIEVQFKLVKGAKGERPAETDAPAAAGDEAPAE